MMYVEMETYKLKVGSALSHEVYAQAEAPADFSPVFGRIHRARTNEVLVLDKAEAQAVSKEAKYFIDLYTGDWDDDGSLRRVINIWKRAYNQLTKQGLL